MHIDFGAAGRTLRCDQEGQHDHIRTREILAS